MGIVKVLWEALTLNANFYEDAHQEPKANQLALMVVSLAALSHAVGSSVILLIYGVPLLLLLFALIINGLSVVAGYYLWTYSIFKIGRWWRFSVPAYEDLLGPIGFAHAPQALNFLTVIPLLGRPIEIGLAMWSLLAAIVAVNQGLGFNLGKTIVMCVPGWLLVQIAIGVVQIMVQGLIT
jgi:hypothetical protein